MKKMKNLLAVFALCASIFVIAGCTTMNPVSDAGAFPSDSSTYEVLGRVELTTRAVNTGYSRLYNEAVAKYPETDDVVNVKVDYKESVFFFIFRFRTYTMSGIAINYK